MTPGAPIGTAELKRLRALRESRPEEVLVEACRLAVELGGFVFAWIGKPSPEGAVKALAHAGHDDGYLESVEILSTDSPEGAGPTGRALRFGLPQLSADIATDPAMGPWREAALARGFKSSGAFPLEAHGIGLAALGVYGPEPCFFTDERMDFLHRLVAELAAALEILERDRLLAEAEAQKRHAEAYYRTLFTQALEGIFVTEPSGQFVDANDAGCQLTGYSREELLQLNIRDVLAPEELAARPMRLDALRDGGHIVDERTLVRKDGRHVEIEFSAKQLPGGYLQGVARDITERRRMQEQLAVADRLSSMGLLAAGVAHEMNTPLSVAVMSLQLVEDRVARLQDDAALELRSFLEDAKEGLDRALLIVRDLRTFSRGGAERSLVDPRVPLQSALRMSAHLLKYHARTELKLDAVPQVRANAARLGQVFLNLLVNSAQALPRERSEANRVTVRSFTDDQGRAVIDVEDNGGGIPPELLPRLFEPFFTTKPEGEGTGLGLPISRQLVVEAGGDLQVESALGKGTRCRVVLPPADGG